MLENVKDITERCQKVEKEIGRKLSGECSPEDRAIYIGAIQAVHAISVRTVISTFAGHVKDNLEVVKNMEIGAPETDKYIKSIMGDTISVKLHFDEDSPNGYLAISPLDAFFGTNVSAPGKEWDAIADMSTQYRRPCEPEDALDLVRRVYHKAEEIAVMRAELNEADYKLLDMYPILKKTILYAGESALQKRDAVTESGKEGHPCKKAGWEEDTVYIVCRSGTGKSDNLGYNYMTMGEYGYYRWGFLSCPFHYNTYFKTPKEAEEAYRNHKKELPLKDGELVFIKECSFKNIKVID